MKEFFAKSGFLGTNGTMGADLSYLLAVVFTLLFLFSWQKARKGEGNIHHNLVLWGTTAMIIYFSGYYLVRRLGVLALEGREGFGGPDWVYKYIFTPNLFIHIILVTFGIFIAVYMIVLGFRTSHIVDGRRVLKNDLLIIKTKNLYIILLSFFAVFGALAFIRCAAFSCFMVYLAGFFLVALILIFEKVVEKILPSGAKRHCLLGKITMTIYFVLLITSTLTYLLLYMLYPPNLSIGLIG